MLRNAAMLTVIFLVALGGYGTKTAHAESSRAKVVKAKNYVHKSQTALRWITTHKRLYRNSRIYHSVIVTWRTNLFYWKKQLAKLTTPVFYIPHYDAWMCIHKFEGSWTDHGAPYYGGLQMDWDFMHTYGLKFFRRYGTADHWSPLIQMYVAERAYSAGRGFYPWPNTARMCGLI